ISTPIRRIRSVCCAPAVTGHATEPPRSVMNSRRLKRFIRMRLPGSRAPRILPKIAHRGSGLCLEVHLSEVGSLPPLADFVAEVFSGWRTKILRPVDALYV